MVNSKSRNIYQWISINYNWWDNSCWILCVISREAGGNSKKLILIQIKIIKIIASSTDNSKLLENLKKLLIVLKDFFCYKSRYEKKYSSKLS